MLYFKMYTNKSSKIIFNSIFNYKQDCKLKTILNVCVDRYFLNNKNKNNILFFL